MRLTYLLTLPPQPQAIANVQSNFDSVRTGRANPAMLDNIEVEYYGSMAPLNTVAGISVPEASTLVVKPFDTSALGDIEKAILASDLGITPNNDGQQIRLSIPDMTEERRKELTKTVGKYAEEGKVAIRNVRRDAMKVAQRCEKDGLISKDRLKEAEDEVQKIQAFDTLELPGLAAAGAQGRPSWRPQVCLGFADAVLTWLRTALDAADGDAYVVTYDPEARAVSFAQDGETSKRRRRE